MKLFEPILKAKSVVDFTKNTIFLLPLEKLSWFSFYLSSSIKRPHRKEQTFRFVSLSFPSLGALSLFLLDIVGTTAEKKGTKEMSEQLSISF